MRQIHCYIVLICYFSSNIQRSITASIGNSLNEEFLRQDEDDGDETTRRNANVIPGVATIVSGVLGGDLKQIVGGAFNTVGNQNVKTTVLDTLLNGLFPTKATVKARPTTQATVAVAGQVSNSPNEGPVFPPKEEVKEEKEEEEGEEEGEDGEEDEEAHS